MASRAARPGTWRSFSESKQTALLLSRLFEDGDAPPEQQQTYDNVIDLLVRTAPRPTLMLASMATRNEQRMFKIRQVQRVNDAISDEEAIAWYQRALELTL